MTRLRHREQLRSRQPLRIGRTEAPRQVAVPHAPDDQRRGADRAQVLSGGGEPVRVSRSVETQDRGEAVPIPKLLEHRVDEGRLVTAPVAARLTEPEVDE